MLERISLDISPEGESFKTRITELLTKKVLSEASSAETLAYVDSEAENTRFDGKDTDDVLEMFGVGSPHKGFEVSERYGHKVLAFLPEGGYDSVIMYIHGGAYVFGYTDIYFRFNETLAKRCRAKVVSPIYPLASSHRKDIYEKAYEHLLSVYLALVSEGRPVYIMGDSSGGAMSLRLAQMIRDRKIVPPAGLVLLSPYVDATLSDPIPSELVERDITLDRFGLDMLVHLWAGDTDLSDPSISPLNGPMDGLPETLIVAGGDEIFLPSNEALARKMDLSGTDVTLVVYNGSYHIFPVYTHLPESEAVMEHIIKMTSHPNRIATSDL